MEIIRRVENNVAYLEISGRIDTITSGCFQQQVTEVLGQELRELVLDFGKVDYISSAGLRGLLVIAKFAGRRDIPVIFTHVTGMVLEVLEMSGFDSFFMIKES